VTQSGVNKSKFENALWYLRFLCLLLHILLSRTSHMLHACLETYSLFAPFRIQLRTGSVKGLSDAFVVIEYRKQTLRQRKTFPSTPPVAWSLEDWDFGGSSVGPEFSIQRELLRTTTSKMGVPVRSERYGYKDNRSHCKVILLIWINTTSETPDIIRSRYE
jgi:hypothetical protein